VFAVASVWHLTATRGRLTRMRRGFQSSLLDLLLACIMFVVGFARRWAADGGMAGQDKNDFVVTVGPDALGNRRTTVKWGDGRTIKVGAGKIPAGASERDGSFTILGRAVTKAERRQFEKQHGLVYGALTRG
jgi:hypothetical protein